MTRMRLSFFVLLLFLISTIANELDVNTNIDERYHEKINDITPRATPTPTPFSFSTFEIPKTNETLLGYIFRQIDPKTQDSKGQILFNLLNFITGAYRAPLSENTLYQLLSSLSERAPRPTHGPATNPPITLPPFTIRPIGIPPILRPPFFTPPPYIPHQPSPIDSILQAGPRVPIYPSYFGLPPRHPSENEMLSQLLLLDALLKQYTRKPTPPPTTKPKLDFNDIEILNLLHLLEKSHPPPTHPPTRPPFNPPFWWRLPHHTANPQPTARPTQHPLPWWMLIPPITAVPTRQPTLTPFPTPTVRPTIRPTRLPDPWFRLIPPFTAVPTRQPTLTPFPTPTVRPTLRPTRVPDPWWRIPPVTAVPTLPPTLTPFPTPTVRPTLRPTRVPDPWWIHATPAPNPRGIWTPPNPFPQTPFGYNPFLQFLNPNQGLEFFRELNNKNNNINKILPTDIAAEILSKYPGLLNPLYSFQEHLEEEQLIHLMEIFEFTKIENQFDWLRDVFSNLLYNVFESVNHIEDIITKPTTTTTTESSSTTTKSSSSTTTSQSSTTFYPTTESSISSMTTYGITIDGPTTGYQTTIGSSSSLPTTGKSTESSLTGFTTRPITTESGTSDLSTSLTGYTTKQFTSTGKSTESSLTGFTTRPITTESGTSDLSTSLTGYTTTPSSSITTSKTTGGSGSSTITTTETSYGGFTTTGYKSTTVFTPIPNTLPTKNHNVSPIPLMTSRAVTIEK